MMGGDTIRIGRELVFASEVTFAGLSSKCGVGLIMPALSNWLTETMFAARDGAWRAFKKVICTALPATRKILLTVPFPTIAKSPSDDRADFPVRSGIAS
jgi:hypothetical protein